MDNDKEAIHYSIDLYYVNSVNSNLLNSSIQDNARTVNTQI